MICGLIIPWMQFFYNHVISISQKISYLLMHLSKFVDFVKSEAVCISCESAESKVSFQGRWGNKGSMSREHEHFQHRVPSLIEICQNTLRRWRDCIALETSLFIIFAEAHEGLNWSHDTIVLCNRFRGHDWYPLSACRAYISRLWCGPVVAPRSRESRVRWVYKWTMATALRKAIRLRNK